MIGKTPRTPGHNRISFGRSGGRARRDAVQTPFQGFGNGGGLEPLEPRVLLSTNLILADADLAVSFDAIDPSLSAVVLTANAKKPGNGGGGGGGPGGGGGGGSATPRATWIWGQETLTLLDDTVVRADALAFLAQKNVTTAYLYAGQIFASGPYPLLESPAQFAQLVSDFQGSGIEVYGLLDSIDVSADAVIVDQFQNLLDFNAAHPAAEQLVGVNLDIEPWIDPAWTTDQARLSQDYLALADQLIDLRDQGGSSIAIGPAMPFWFDTYSVDYGGVNQPMNQHVQDAFDYTTVMAFRDTARGADGIITHAQNEIDYGSLIGKPVVIGVETNDVGLDKLTFFEEGESTMESELNRVKREFKSDASFAGFAIQDFAGYLSLANSNILASSSTALMDAVVVGDLPTGAAGLTEADLGAVSHDSANTASDATDAAAPAEPAGLDRGARFDTRFDPLIVLSRPTTDADPQDRPDDIQRYDLVLLDDLS